MLKIINLVTILLLLIACSRQKQVWFTELQGAHLGAKSGAVRLYLDKYGDAYPDKYYYIPFKNFFKNTLADGTKLKQVDIKTGSLDFYFTGRYIDNDGGLLGKLKVDQRPIKELAKLYGIDQAYTDDQIFDESQNRIISNVVDEINSDLKKKKTNTLLILVHGFNDPNPSGDYKMIRDKVNEITTSEFSCLEIYWDGLTANGGNPGSEKIWGKAQVNAMQSAVTLRRILSLLEEDTKVRIIGHSSGAILTTGALFNCTSKWKKPLGLLNYSKMIKDSVEAPTNLDLRMGFIAPAIPGQSTFMDFNNRGNRIIFPTQNNISRIVIGYNANDLATTKRIGKFDGLSNKFGATSLGADRKGEVHKTLMQLEKLKYKNTDTLYVPVDFREHCYKCKKNCCNGKKTEEHGAYYYMINPAFRPFVEALFN